MTLDITTRRMWGGQTPRWSWKLHLPVTSVFTSYTYSSPCSSYNSCVEEVQYLERHATRIRNCPAVRYNFLIGGDGSIYEGRGWYSRPSLPPKYTMYNKRSLYIGLIGIFAESPPSDQMYQSQDNLIGFGMDYSLISKIHLAFTIRPAGRGILTEVL
ncbi:peptidoglycan-recognition protein SB2-like [Macrosteles quadrilineatus]|uniref:peptidoglycan-recognition protein SB2-like n=1 Tax=Macrosteles quadrilineatus TaxID=74068 RepID=UPI0023E09107|nr:peptidoglycan-recognition protein SB2-like [Macrosteles quadrilineatus]